MPTTEVVLQTLTKKITEDKVEMETFCSCYQEGEEGPRIISSESSTDEHRKTCQLRN